MVDSIWIAITKKEKKNANFKNFNSFIDDVITMMADVVNRLSKLVKKEESGWHEIAGTVK